MTQWIPSFFLRMALLFTVLPCAVISVGVLALQFVQTAKSKGHDGEREYWVVSPTGSLLATNSPSAVPVSVSDLKTTPAEGITLRLNQAGTQQQISIIPAERAEMFFVTRKVWSSQKWLAGFVVPAATVIILSVFFGLGLTLFIFHRESRTAQRVLDELKRGNLQSRFSPETVIKFGPIIDQFNEMAGEIERLVNQLRRSEALRAMTLQDLAHDVRTPVASIWMAIEQLQDEKKAAQKKVREKKIGLITDELSFLTSLLDGLLTIAQTQDPSFETRLTPIAVWDVLNDEISVVKKGKGAKLKWQIEGDSGAPLRIAGNREILARAFRNLLENAVAHADKRVTLTVTETSGFVEIVVRNDGGRFSEEDLNRFGTRKNVRIIPIEKRKKGSVGLGSVIVATATKKMQGTWKVGNWSKGKTVGAEVVLTFPLLDAITIRRTA